MLLILRTKENGIRIYNKQLGKCNDFIDYLKTNESKNYKIKLQMAVALAGNSQVRIVISKKI